MVAAAAVVVVVANMKTPSGMKTPIATGVASMWALGRGWNASACRAGGLLLGGLERPSSGAAGKGPHGEHGGCGPPPASSL